MVNIITLEVKNDLDKISQSLNTLINSLPFVGGGCWLMYGDGCLKWEIIGAERDHVIVGTVA